MMHRLELTWGRNYVTCGKVKLFWSENVGYKITIILVSNFILKISFFSEPYNCNGHFQTDFTELCRRNSMAVIPPVVLRAKPPTMMSQTESSKPDKGSQKGKQAQAQAEPEPEVELDEEGGGC